MWHWTFCRSSRIHPIHSWFMEVGIIHHLPKWWVHSHVKSETFRDKNHWKCQEQISRFTRILVDVTLIVQVDVQCNWHILMLSQRLHDMMIRFEQLRCGVSRFFDGVWWRTRKTQKSGHTLDVPGSVAWNVIHVCGRIHVSPTCRW